MYCIFAYIYHKEQLLVCIYIYQSHGSYGITDIVAWEAVDLLQANHVVLVQVAPRNQAMGKMYQLDICGSHDGIKHKSLKNICALK